MTTIDGGLAVSGRLYKPCTAYNGMDLSWSMEAVGSCHPPSLWS